MKKRNLVVFILWILLTALLFERIITPINHYIVLTGARTDYRQLMMALMISGALLSFGSLYIARVFVELVIFSFNTSQMQKKPDITEIEEVRYIPKAIHVSPELDKANEIMKNAIQKAEEEFKKSKEEK